MKILEIMSGLTAVVVVATACEVFEDQAPEVVWLRMSGSAGETVSLIYSKQFVAGVDELGITRVEVFRADTVSHVLPVDTIIDVHLEQRIYIQALPGASTPVTVDVRVDVDDRNIFDRSGDLFPDDPWHFLYQYNVRFTDAIEVII